MKAQILKDAAGYVEVRFDVEHEQEYSFAVHLSEACGRDQSSVELEGSHTSKASHPAQR
jgi:hypothetical protein